MHRMVYSGMLQGAYREELLFDRNLYHFTSIRYFCNLNTLLTWIYLGMVKKRKGGEGKGGGKRKEEEKWSAWGRSQRLDQSHDWLRHSGYSFSARCRVPHALPERTSAIYMSALHRSPSYFLQCSRWEWAWGEAQLHWIKLSWDGEVQAGRFWSRSRWESCPVPWSTLRGAGGGVSWVPGEEGVHPGQALGSFHTTRQEMLDRKSVV